MVGKGGGGGYAMTSSLSDVCDALGPEPLPMACITARFGAVLRYLQREHLVGIVQPLCAICR